jgi:hypothetical protein
MSLINEALRKARQAAAEHDEQHARSRPPIAYPSRGPRRGIGVAAVALIAAAAGIGGAAVVWWTMAHPDTGRPQAGAAAPASESADAEVFEKSAGAVEAPVVPAAAEAPTAGALPTAIGGSGADREAARPTDVENDSQAEPGDAPDGPAAAAEDRRPASVRKRPDRGPDGERVFILDAVLGEVTLSLDFIVFRPVRPFAEINGIEVYEGSDIEGIRVERIEADRIVLRDDEGLIVLRVP